MKIGTGTRVFWAIGTLIILLTSADILREAYRLTELAVPGASPDAFGDAFAPILARVVVSWVALIHLVWNAIVVGAFAEIVNAIVEKRASLA